LKEILFLFIGGILIHGTNKKCKIQKNLIVLHLKKKYLHILVLVGDLHFILSRNLLGNIPNNVCHLTQLFIFISLSYARFSPFISEKNAFVFCRIYDNILHITTQKVWQVTYTKPKRQSDRWEVNPYKYLCT